jgi:hypothetical protein
MLGQVIDLVEGDALNRADVEKALAGRDAVPISIDHHLEDQCVTRSVEAAQAQGIERISYVSVPGTQAIEYPWQRLGVVLPDERGPDLAAAQVHAPAPGERRLSARRVRRGAFGLPAVLHHARRAASGARRARPSGDRRAHLVQWPRVQAYHDAHHYERVRVRLRNRAYGRATAVEA